MSDLEWHDLRQAVITDLEAQLRKEIAGKGPHWRARARNLHLALEVVDLEAAIARVVAAGGRLVIAPVPDVAFGERRIAFVYLGGQITELIELPR